MDILVIEDDPTVQKIISKALERGGYMVKCVGNGLQAIAELQQSAFEAIVCDVGLPFLEGTSLFDHLKSEYPHMATRVLFVTGMAHDPATKKFLGATGRPFLAKPFTVDDLLESVRAVVEQSRGSKPRKKRKG